MPSPRSKLAPARVPVGLGAVVQPGAAVGDCAVAGINIAAAESGVEKMDWARALFHMERTALS